MSPSSTIPAPNRPGLAPSLRWGVLGTGWIAGHFVNALRRRGSQKVVAVGSRTRERAAAFASKHEIQHAAGTAEELVDRADIDIVYIASPHVSHRPLSELALRAGKHVLIEKPIAPTVSDARAILDVASSRGLLAMEAMWTRYLPQADVIRQLLAQNVIGEVGYVGADFGFVAEYQPDHRLFNPMLAGGALLDAGVYPVSFISSVLGAPLRIHVSGSLAETGVDDAAIVALEYERAVAHATTSLRASLPVTATIAGTRGRIEVLAPFIQPSGIRLVTRDSGGTEMRVGEWVDDSVAAPHDALHYEADAAARYIDEGRSESPIHTHEETVAVIGVLEEARRQLRAA